MFKKSVCSVKKLEFFYEFVGENRSFRKKRGGGKGRGRIGMKGRETGRGMGCIGGKGEGRLREARKAREGEKAGGGK